MTQPIRCDPIHRGRRYQTETIGLCVRWYITYRLSYRDLAAMMAERGIIVSRSRWPQKVNLGGNAASHRALSLLGKHDAKWKAVVVRCCRYLNNIVEQDRRAIKQRCASILGQVSFKTAAITFAGIELANRIRKRQFAFGRGAPTYDVSLKEVWDRGPRLDSNCLIRECTRTQIS